jgi:integrase/recombinase XerD
MSPLHKVLAEYLVVRRALGFKLERAGHLLPHFIAFLDRHGARTVTTDLALAWARLPSAAHPDWWAARLGLVRSFAKYLQTLDPRTEVPPAQLTRRPVRRATPYLYSQAEVARLIHAAQGLRPLLRSQTYATLIGLLAVTGMRIGEAIGLDRLDVDCAHAVIVVRASKFGKSRELPLHKTTAMALAAHLRLRNKLCPHPRTPAFFVSQRGTRLIYQNVHFTFLRLARAAALRPRSVRCRPRIHDLRHTFAVRTLLDWYRRGSNVEAHLPRLSTYLGHSGPTFTYWYLSAAPELMALAAARLERTLGRLP